MEKFQKLVAIEPTRLFPEDDERLQSYAKETIIYKDSPKDSQEVIRRIGDADCVLVSYTTPIGRDVLEACKNIRYIGMCCSLYSPESANVDILRANALGIVVKGVRQYGDEGVRDYVVSELARFLLGRGEVMWKEEPMELTGVSVGIIGMGDVGSIVAKTLNFFDMKVHYYSRTRKPEMESQHGCTYLGLHDLLETVDIVITCLNRNVILLGREEFQIFGSGKIYMNLSIGPAFEVEALKEWLQDGKNYAFCDTILGLTEEISKLSNVCCGNRSVGMTSLAKVRLAQKVRDNIENFWEEKEYEKA